MYYEEDEEQRFSEGEYFYGEESGSEYSEPEIPKGELQLRKKNLREELQVASKVKGSAKEVKSETLDELSELVPTFLEKYRKTQLPYCAIGLLRSIRFNPPHVVKVILEAICILKGIGPVIKKDKEGKRYDDFWPPAQKLLSGNLIEELEELRNPGNICWTNIESFQEKYKTNPEFNDRPKIKRAFGPALILYDWVMAIEDYATILKEIEEREIKWFFANCIVQEKRREQKFIKIQINRVRSALHPKEYFEEEFDEDEEEYFEEDEEEEYEYEEE